MKQQKFSGQFESIYDLAVKLARAVDAGRVHEDDLHVVPCQDAQNTAARSLWLGGDDGYLLPNDPVHQG